MLKKHDALSGPAEIIVVDFPFAMPRLIGSCGPGARQHYLEFFSTMIGNKQTRRVYARASVEFLGWCSLQGVVSLAAVKPLHVATWIDEANRRVSAPTVKQRLAGVRHLFDWLVTVQVVPVNPTASVQGPSHGVRRGQAPVLRTKEARTLLDAIDATTPAGLRDRTLIGQMV